MREDAREKFSDIAWSEAMNDDLVSAVTGLKVERIVIGEKSEELVTSNALNYLLIDEFRLGMNNLKSIYLKVTFPDI